MAEFTTTEHEGLRRVHQQSQTSQKKEPERQPRTVMHPGLQLRLEWDVERALEGARG